MIPVNRREGTRGTDSQRGGFGAASLLAHGSRRQFATAVALMSVIPLLTVWAVARQALIAPGTSLDLWQASIVSLAVVVFVSCGVVILRKYPTNIRRLRNALQGMVQGEFPEAVDLIACADDMRAIQEALNILLDRMKARISTVEEEKGTLEKQLCQAQKLETIGVLAAGITHEINAPVQFARDNLAFIENQLAHLLTSGTDAARAGDSPAPANVGDARQIAEFAAEAHQAIAESQEGLNQVVQIAAAMKNYLHPGRERMRRPVDINRLVEETITLSRNQWKYVADIQTRLDPDLPTVHGVAGDIRQALLNLVINAAAALEEAAEIDLPHKGAISIETSCNSDAVIIRIADTGNGIPRNIRDRVFERFFTTKPEGKGTGMGLSLAYMFIAERHDGSLSFDTDEGKGTVFTVTLPISAKSKTSEAHPSHEQSTRRDGSPIKPVPAAFMPGPNDGV